MIATSDKYKVAIGKEKRVVKSRVIIDYSDPFLDNSVTFNTSLSASISHVNQVADVMDITSGKIASLDGSWVLDGSYVSAPIDGIMRQMGWWSANLSDINGSFSEDTFIEVEFSKRSIRTLRVCGDTSRQEWPVDFNILLYSSSNLVHTESVTNNDLVQWKKEIDTPFSDITKMRLNILKWSHPGRQAKIIEFFTSLQIVYEGSDVISMDVLEEMESSSGSLPIGNISANEVDIKLYNRNNLFDFGNESSFLNGMLKPNRRVRPFAGLQVDDDEIEWIPLGVYYTKDWDIPEQDVTVTLTARDRLDSLRSSLYFDEQVLIGRNAHFLFEKVLQDAGLSSEEYLIDETLLGNDFSIHYMFFDGVSHREVLKKLAEACLCYIYCDRQGRIVVKSLGEGYVVPELSVDNIMDLYQNGEIEGMSYQLVDGELSVFIDNYLDRSYYTKDNPIKWTNVANEIVVDYFWTEQTPSVSNRQIDLGFVHIGNHTFTVEFDKYPSMNSNVYYVIEGTTAQGTLSNYVKKAKSITFDFNCTESGNLIVGVTNDLIEVSLFSKRIFRDEESIKSVGLISYVMPKNELIAWYGITQQVGQKLLDFYKEPQATIRLSLFSDPAWELGDVLYVKEGSSINVYRISKQSIELNQTLETELEGRRA